MEARLIGKIECGAGWCGDFAGGYDKVRTSKGGGVWAGGFRDPKLDR